MTQEYVDKAIEDFPEWPDNAIGIWVYNRLNNSRDSFYALSETITDGGALDGASEGDAYYKNGRSFEYSVYHQFWHKVTREEYDKRKAELSTPHKKSMQEVEHLLRQAYNAAYQQGVTLDNVYFDTNTTLDGRTLLLGIEINAKLQQGE